MASRTETKEPYKPDWKQDENGWFYVHYGDRLITNIGTITAPWPAGPKSLTTQGWVGYDRRMDKWLATEANKVVDYMHYPVRFDPKHMHDYEAAYRFLFDPSYKEIIEQWAEKHRIESSRYLVFEFD